VSDSESVEPKRPRTAAEPKRRLSAADSRPPFASVRPRAWAAFASGSSLRAVARAEGCSRSAIERLARKEGWVRERKAIRARVTAQATARASKAIEAKLGEVKRLGIDVRIAGLRRTRKAISRKRLDGNEAQAIRDLSTSVKNLDLHAEAARAPQVNIDNKNMFGVSYVETLEESRKPQYSLPCCNACPKCACRWKANCYHCSGGSGDWDSAAIDAELTP
jgi:hypothetical protein